MNLRFAFRAAAIAAVLLCSMPAFAQKGQTSMGTDFWLGFLPNSLSLLCCPPQGSELYIASPTANEVRVQVFGGFKNPVETFDTTLAPNSVWELPTDNEALWETDTQETARYRAIHITSRSPIEVYGYEHSGAPTYSGDSYLALPTPALGNTYDAICYWDGTYDNIPPTPPQPLAGEFLVISPYDSNTVTIGPLTTATRGDDFDALTTHQTGDTWSVTLMKGQTYLVQSTGKDWNEDLTGTPIKSSKPVAVLSGHQLAAVGQEDAKFQRSLLVEMILPTSEWDSEAYFVPTPRRTLCGDNLQFVAASTTRVSPSSMECGPLIQSDPSNSINFLTCPTYFHSSGGNFLMVQREYQIGVRGDSTPAHPFASLLTPARQFQKQMFFSTMQRPGVTPRVTFVGLDDSLPALLLNGRPLRSYPYVAHVMFDSTRPLMGAYTIALPDTTITYHASSTTPFGCTLYGLSLHESYGSPASLGLTVSSTDTQPPVESRDSICTSFQVTLSEHGRQSPRIADVGMILDSGDLRCPTPSYNFAMAFDSTFTPGDSTASIALTVFDPGKDAYAAVWTTDRAGNDTVYQYSYHAPRISPVPDSAFTFGSILAGTDSCKTITLRNASTGIIAMTNATILNGGTTSYFSVTPSTLNRTLEPGDTLQLHLCFSPTDTLVAHDTLEVTAGCAPLRYPVQGTSAIPLILAGNLGFGNVTVGDMSCSTLSVQNVGTLPLILYPNSLIADTTDFSFVTLSSFPFTIAPGRAANFQVCFHPHSVGAIQTTLTWATNLLAPFTHSIKDTSILLGFGAPPAGVASSDARSLRFEISPNPATQMASIRLDGAPSAFVQVFDVLGREVARFRVAGSYEWQMGALPPGTYIVRADAGETVVSKQVVKK